jgi:hypothetical protein
MFDSCTALQFVPMMDTSKVTNGYSMFMGCESLISVPHFKWDQLQNGAAMFRGCKALPRLPTYDFPELTNGSDMFSRMDSLVEFPPCTMPKVTDLSQAWYANKSMSVFPALNLPECTKLSQAWQSCTSLEDMPMLTFPKLESLSGAFWKCKNLRTIPRWHTQTVKDWSNAFTDSMSTTTGTVNFQIQDFQAAEKMVAVFSDNPKLIVCPIKGPLPGTITDGLGFAFRKCQFTTFPANVFNAQTHNKYTLAFQTTNLDAASKSRICDSIVASPGAAVAGGRLDISGGTASTWAGTPPTGWTWNVA